MTDPASPPPADLAAARARLRRAALLTAGVGLAFSATFITGYLLLGEAQDQIKGLLEQGATGDIEVSGGGELAAHYLMPFSAIFFLWFIVALRGWMRGSQRRQNELVGDAQLVSGAVFTAVFSVGAGTAATVVILASSGAEAIAFADLRVLANFGDTLVLVFGSRIAGVFVIATGTLGITTMVLPRWFALLSYVFGALLMLAPVADERLFLAFPVWVGALSIMLGYHLAHVPVDQLPGFAQRDALRKG